MMQSGQRKIEMGGRSSRSGLETNTSRSRFAIACCTTSLVHG